MARNAVGAETWKVTGGRTTFNFYAGLLQDHGITLEQVDITASTPDPIMMDLEPPYWSWAITPESDLEFSVENEHFVFYAIKGGAIRHQGGLTFKDAVSGTSRDLRNWVMDYVATDHDGPGGEPDPAIFFGRQPQVGSPYTVYFHDEMPIFRRDQKRLIMYATAKITADWAQQLGRPWLADQAIARIEVAADVEYVSGASTEAPFEPIITGTLRDVKLGFLDSITELGHVGTYPNGTSGVSMATTSCNIGDVDVNWFAPMNPDHPGIVMSIYRLLNGRFEQVGLSYVKHGFYALSSSQCTPCQHPSPGTFLGVGCSDTYSSGNNGDRTYLGPRREWNPFT
jgi:hypothetical protein